MRTFEAAFLNEIANQPSIRSMLGGEGPIELTPLLKDPRNFAFVNGYGGFFAHRKMDALYEIHTIFSPCPFREVLSLAEKAQDFMFTYTACDQLVTLVPDDNRGAALLAVKGHFKKIDRIEEWKPGVGADVMAFHIDSWTKVCCGASQLGRAIYLRLEQAARVRNTTFSFLRDEEIFHRMLGVMAQMAMVGNVAKGVDLFNKWSLSRGGRPVILYSSQPVAIDVIDAVIGIENGEWEVMLCR